MNVYDSHRIAAILEQLGFTPASNIKNADLVIFNTCHIREKAAEKVFSDNSAVSGWACGAVAQCSTLPLLTSEQG